MLEWMLGLLIVAALIAKILESIDLIDLSELIGGLLELIARLLFSVAAFLVCLVTRRGKEQKSG
jgi:hypothetical protein